MDYNTMSDIAISEKATEGKHNLLKYTGVGILIIGIILLVMGIYNKTKKNMTDTDKTKGDTFVSVGTIFIVISLGTYGLYLYKPEWFDFIN